MDFVGQAETFIVTILTGMLLGILFDFYRVLRGIFHPRAVITLLTDILYWLMATVVVFGALLISNWGELRFYVFIGLLSGMLVYYRLLSRVTVILLIRTMRIFVIILRWCRKIMVWGVIRPVSYFCKIIRLPFVFTGRQVNTAGRRMASWYKNKWPPPPEN